MKTFESWVLHSSLTTYREVESFAKVFIGSIHCDFALIFSDVQAIHTVQFDHCTQWLNTILRIDTWSFIWFVSNKTHLDWTSSPRYVVHSLRSSATRLLSGSVSLWQSKIRLQNRWRSDVFQEMYEKSHSAQVWNIDHPKRFTDFKVGRTKVSPKGS